MRAALLAVLVARVACDVQVRHRALESYHLQTENCVAQGGVPVEIKLMKSDSAVQSGWGSSYFSLNYYDPMSAQAGRLDRGSFAGQGNIDTRSVCLEQDMKYSFSVSKNANAFEIGAVMCGNNFVKAGETLHFSVQDSACSPFSENSFAASAAATSTAAADVVRTLQSSSAGSGGHVYLSLIHI